MNNDDVSHPQLLVLLRFIGSVARRGLFFINYLQKTTIVVYVLLSHVLYNGTIRNGDGFCNNLQLFFKFQFYAIIQVNMSF